MTLDEQIAWLQEDGEAARRSAKADEDSAQWYADHARLSPNYPDFGRHHAKAAEKYRERAATLLTIENTLRAMRDAQG